MRELYKKTKWLRFFIVDRKPKTVVCEVWNTREQYLGMIRWYPSWRKYVFYSQPDLIFDVGCLIDISDVLTALEAERKGGEK